MEYLLNIHYGSYGSETLTYYLIFYRLIIAVLLAAAIAIGLWLWKRTSKIREQQSQQQPPQQNQQSQQMAQQPQFTAPMKCPHCGGTIKQGDIFCVNCGNRI